VCLTHLKSIVTFSFLGIHITKNWVWRRIILWQRKSSTNSNPSGFLHCFSLWSIWRPGLLCPSSNINIWNATGAFPSSGKNFDRNWLSNFASSHWWSQNKLSFLQRTRRRLSQNSNPKPFSEMSPTVSSLWPGPLDEKLLQQLWKKKVQTFLDTMRNGQLPKGR